MKEPEGKLKPEWISFMQIVSIEKAESYDIDLVRASLRRLLAPLGGMSAFVRPGERVLLKPNMLYGKHPDAAVTTHPVVVQAVIELVREAGGLPLVGDSPGNGATRKVAEQCGILEVVRKSGAELVEFSDTVAVRGEGLYKKFELARPYLEADKVINLPKLKTHVMMTMTCAVKNLFGAVIGREKSAWHLKAGKDRSVFARMLVEIYLLRRPDLTIVDAITAMEGDGPGSGDPCHVGLLLAGANALAVDMIAGEIAGIPEELLYVGQIAAKMGLEGADRKDIQVVGVDPGELSLRPFRLPRSMSISFGLPEILGQQARNQFTVRPVVIPELCEACGICVDACPPQAMALDNGKLEIDYKSCIRCYCCVELCPEKALDLKAGALLGAVKRFRKVVGKK